MTSIVSYYNDAIQELNSTNLNDLYDTVLEHVATTTFAGSLAIGTPIGNNTLIGYFTDTARSGAPGSDGISVVSNTYSVYQYTDTTQTTPSPNVISLQYDTIVDQFNDYALEYFAETYSQSEIDVIVLQENYNLMSNIADNILARMVTGYGVGSYYLGNTTPVGDTGVWQNLGKFEDTLNNFTELNNTYFLWQKISSGNSKTLLTPLKLNFGVVGDYNTSELVEFTTSEINNILYYVERRFLDTGIGTYILDSTAPVTGVWSNVGVISDFIRTIDTNNYLNEFSDTYTRSYELEVPYSTDYANVFDGPVFTAQSEFDGGSFTDVFSDAYITDYTADYLNEDAIDYTGVTPVDYSGPVAYTGDDGANFTGAVPTTYSGPVAYTGDNGANFIGPSPVSYAGPVTYVGDNGQNFIGGAPTTYAGPVTYVGDNAVNFTGFVPGVTYAGPASFVNPNAVGFVGSVPTTYSGPVNYTGDNAVFFSASVTFLGFAYYINENFVPFQLEGPTYVGGPLQSNKYVLSQFYLGTAVWSTNTAPYTGAGPTYSGPAVFTNPNAASFAGQAAAFYAGPATYVGDNGANFTAGVPTNYAGPASFVNPGAQNFTGFVPTAYAGPAAFVNPDAQNFTGFVPTTYSGPTPFTNPDAANFTGFVPTTYSGPAPFINPDVDIFTGLVPATYSGADVYDTTFVDAYTAEYISPEYTATYTGAGGEYTSTFEGSFISEYTGTSIYQQLYTTLYENLYEKQTVAPSLQQNPSVTLWVRIG